LSLGDGAGVGCGFQVEAVFSISCSFFLWEAVGVDHGVVIGELVGEGVGEGLGFFAALRRVGGCEP
jgi:hypothetical protein